MMLRDQIPAAPEGPATGIRGTDLSAKEWIQKQEAEKSWDWEKSGRPVEPIRSMQRTIGPELDMSQYQGQRVDIPQTIDQGEPPLHAMSSEERERYRYENAMNESQTFSPQYDLVKPTGRSNRAYDLQKSLRLQNLIYGRGRRLLEE